ncbi:dethiobiotin synthase [Hydrogenovibrio kuenenii]|uniref:dethiobiotin synthase n=1 Tax=Hydrogenovibrio kuenenii TaxID=63658 RepID=UPI0004643AF4|nr:dethiobiotin synthase [Hydrogenovibrio kuenenii]
MTSQSNNKGFFITGTDTEIGKTFVTGSIGHTLHQANIAATPRKPVASGCITQADGSLISEDALFLQSSFKTPDSLEQICPYLFEQAVSPKLAMELNNSPLSISDLAVNCRITNNDDIVFVEGAGGFYSPLAMDGLNADLAVMLGHPVILVVGDRLGCINHALLTIEAIQNRGLKLAAVVINQLHPSKQFTQGLENLVSVPIFSCPHSESGKPATLPNELVELLVSA